MGSTAAERPSLLVAPLTRLPCDPAVLRAPLERAFSASVTLRPLPLDLDSTYDRNRNQLNSTAILRLLLAEDVGEQGVLGLVDQDLFVPVLTYVFGEAQLGGRVAVASTFRLREPWAGGGASDAVLEARLIKTALHELGHTRGLRHCARPGCVMTSASGLEMLDEKQAAFCLSCQAAL
jgi:archaemetzincin